MWIKIYLVQLYGQFDYEMNKIRSFAVFCNAVSETAFFPLPLIDYLVLLLPCVCVKDGKFQRGEEATCGLKSFCYLSGTASGK